MTEAQFVSWLKTFLAGKQFLSEGDTAALKATLQNLSRTTNESTDAPGKQWLHG